MDPPSSPKVSIRVRTQRAPYNSNLFILSSYRCIMDRLDRLEHLQQNLWNWGEPCSDIFSLCASSSRVQSAGGGQYSTNPESGLASSRNNPSNGFQQQLSLQMQFYLFWLRGEYLLPYAVCSPNPKPPSTPALVPKNISKLICILRHFRNKPRQRIANLPSMTAATVFVRTGTRRKKLNHAP